MKAIWKFQAKFPLEAFYPLFFIGFFTHFWIFDFFRILFGLTLLLMIFPLYGLQWRHHFDSNLNELSVRFPKWPLRFLMIFIPLIILANWILDFESLKGSAWDLGFYIQATHNFANTGLATATFQKMIEVSYDGVHRSLSIFLLGPLYQVFRSPYVVLIYQTVIQIFPAFGILWYARLKNPGRDHLYFLLVFLFYFLSTNFLFQGLWPFAFHILGVLLLLLAYIGYLEKSPLLWTGPLALLCFEKEEFSLIAMGFVFVVWIDSFVKKDRKLLLYSFIVLIFALIGMSFKSAKHTGWQSFGLYFGQFGQTATEAVKTVLTRPSLFIEALTKPYALKYLLFFLFVSGIWLRPTWRTARLFLPVLPLMIVNSLAIRSNFQNIDAHYSILIGLAACVTVIFGVAESPTVQKGSYRNALLLLFIGLNFFPAEKTWMSQFYHTLSNFSSATEDRKVLTKYQDGQEVLCCERELCAYLAARRYLYFLDDCLSNLKFPFSHNLPVRFISKANSEQFYSVQKFTPIEAQTPKVSVFSVMKNPP